MKTEELDLPDPASVSDESIPPMLAKLAALQSALSARLLLRKPLQELGSDRLLTVAEAAAKLRTSKDWLYRNGSRLPKERKVVPFENAAEGRLE